jgi:predicted metal-dependent phosphoesterase TrpH
MRSRGGRIDLHLHTNASDGTFSPSDVVERALALGLSAISITDHDSIDGVGEAISASGGRILVVPGVEISADLDGREVHILGYFIDWQEERLRKDLLASAKSRLSRAEEMVERLRGLGIDLGMDDVTAISGGGTVTRLHIALAMKEKGYVRTTEEAFERYIGEGKPAYVERIRLSPKEAISMIRRAGGIPVLAHPGLLKRDEVIPVLIKEGLEGIEAYHSKHSLPTIEHYIALARRLGLLVTGGSDCHGEVEGGPLIGSLDIPESILDPLEKRAAEIRGGL